jgi:parallel beta-helix repeat protein
MKRKCLAVGIILLFVGTSVIPAIAQDMEKPSLPTSSGHWLYVGGSGPGNYTKIQDAIDNASDGDIVFVFNESSPYYETLKIEKSIDLIGEDAYSTVINGERKNIVINVLADGVVLEGFTICNYNGTQQGPGLRLHANFSFITNNIITDCEFGISIYYSHNNNISHNIIKVSDPGILIWRASNNSIFNNFISDQTNGIYNFQSSNNLISYNIFRNQSESGVNLEQTSNERVIHNIIINSSISGISLQHTKNTNEIKYNSINSCNISIDLWNCSNQIIKYNIIRDSYLGINLITVESNSIWYNSFIHNNITALFFNSYRNGWRMNYWNRPRLLPYLIFGINKFGDNSTYWINVDWRPALKPYVIS